MLHELSSEIRQATGRKLVVSLTVSPEGTPLVASCEVIGETYRNRTSWHKPRTIDEVMQPQMAETVMACLGKVTGKSEVISLPHLVLEHTGLVLSHAHLIATAKDCGDLSVILRFKTFLGSLSAVFQPHVDLVNGASAATMAVSDRIMMDISMPLLNFLSLDEQGGLLGKDDAQRLVSQLTDQSHALRFQIELIKRHVARLEAAQKSEQRTAQQGKSLQPKNVTLLDDDVAYVEANSRTRRNVI